MNYGNNELHDIFQRSFDIEIWTKVMTNLFQADSIRAVPERLDSTPDNTEGYYLGCMDTTDHYRIGFFHYKIKGNVKRKKVGLRRLVRSFTNPKWGLFDAALAVFEGDDEEWRLSLVSDIKGEETAPKRFTYVFGDSKGAYRTPVSRFCLLQQGDITFHNLMDTFSVEALTREFYNDLFGWYQWATDPKTGVTFPNDTSTPADDREDIGIKIIRLITRLMFVWFIKQKDLVPDILFDAAKLKDKLRDFEPLSKTDGCYYNAILQNLFFATLNRAIIDDNGQTRQFAHREGKDAKTLYRYADRFTISEGEVVKMFASVPFLNGGLFDCLDKTRTLDGVEKSINYDGFSRNNSRFQNGRYKHIAVVPNCLFFDNDHGLLSIFKRYNFTVEENSHNEQQVALDPELLGKVFENLLGAYNPETRETARNESGSFYTPREIVSYMVDESLMAYLGNSDTVKELFNDDFEKKKGYEEEYRQIAGQLQNVKILDPACGSGAFPMGMLTRITELLQKLEPEADTYKLKLKLIEQCLYGSDIQCIATQITKLRFFISLICNCEKDEKKPNFGIPTLPNLETKFVTADTLTALHRQTRGQQWLTDTNIQKIKERLTDVRHKHFAAKTAAEKAGLRAEDDKLRGELIQLLRNDSVFSSDDARQIAAWNPYDQNASAPFFDPEWMFGVSNGFDIVIGNPPYIQLQNNSGALADKYSDCGYSTFTRAGDIYCLFYERGVQLLKPCGHLCFITSNKWMRAGYGEHTRRFFNEKTDPIKLIDFAGVRVFDSATVDVNILLLAKGHNRHSTTCAVTSHDNAQAVKSDLRTFVDQHHSTCSFDSSNAWTILSPIEQSIRQKIERAGTPLKDWDIQIYRGILTGCNDAFIISTDTRNEILSNCNDDSERRRTEKLIRPILRGRDIKRYGYDWANKWLIATFPTRHYDIDDYPTVKNYLLSFGIERLEQTGRTHTINGIKVKARKKTTHKWFETQDPIAYWQDFDKPKIVWARLMRITKSDVDAFPRFCKCKAGMLVVDSLCFFTGDEKRIGLLCEMLNSSYSAYYFFKNIAILDNGGMQMRQQYVEEIPLPMLLKTKDNINDYDIYNAFCFNEDEIAFIEDFINEKKEEIKKR